MEAIEKLQSAITMVNEARAVPLSASCVVHRGELLGILEEINQALPNDLASAQKLLANREGIIEEGRQSAEQLVVHAREEVARMVEQTAIVAAAREESARLIEEAHLRVEKEREEVDAYIDSRLATLEVILNKTLEAVNRGRDRLAGASDKDVLSQLAD
ncbi:MAG: ATP synthase F0 subunit B [Candidatus Nanopelagicaceae bacterium]|nr:ATP synthase F0 subunit B [Candidatus Nanopelagicaceae bacterium]